PPQRRRWPRHISARSAADRGPGRCIPGAHKAAPPAGIPSRQTGRSKSSDEGLVLSEVGDGEPERVDGNEVVRDAVFDDEQNVGYVLFASRFLVVRTVVDLLEIDRGMVGGRAQILDRNIGDLDVILLALAGEERLDGLGLLVGFDERVSE